MPRIVSGTCPPSTLSFLQKLWPFFNTYAIFFHNRFLLASLWTSSLIWKFLHALLNAPLNSNITPIRHKSYLSFLLIPHLANITTLHYISHPSAAHYNNIHSSPTAPPMVPQSVLPSLVHFSHLPSADFVLDILTFLSIQSVLVFLLFLCLHHSP